MTPLTQLRALASADQIAERIREKINALAPEESYCETYILGLLEEVESAWGRKDNWPATPGMRNPGALRAEHTPRQRYLEVRSMLTEYHHPTTLALRDTIESARKMLDPKAFGQFVRVLQNALHTFVVRKTEGAPRVDAVSNHIIYYTDHPNTGRPWELTPAFRQARSLALAHYALQLYSEELAVLAAHGDSSGKPESVFPNYTRLPSWRVWQQALEKLDPRVHPDPGPARPYAELKPR